MDDKVQREIDAMVAGVKARIEAMTDADFAAIGAREAERQSAELADKRRAVARALLGQGFPQRKVEEAVNAHETEATSLMDGWDFRRQNIAVLAGGTGTGKTTAAVRWCLRNERYGARFMRASTVIAAGLYDHDARAARLSASCLVLDDLGAEHSDSKGIFTAVLDELFDTYYGDGKPLIVTTNLTKKAFAERVGPRVTDRLRESGIWMPLAGASMRGEMK